MISHHTWKIEFDEELEHAVRARSMGNEGMARVCARRAAGIVVGEYLVRRGYTDPIHSTYERLSIFGDLPDVEQNAKDLTAHFLLKVDHTHKLPPEIDLIEDVIFLERSLLNTIIH